MRKLATARLMVGTSSTCADLWYATGFKAEDPIVCLIVGRRVWLVVSGLEYERASARLPQAKIFTPEQLRIRNARRSRVDRWAVGLLRHCGVRRVGVSPRFPLAAADALRAAGITVKVAGQGLLPWRAVKTPAEIRRIREVQRAAVAAMRVAIDMIAGSTPDARGRLRLGSELLTSEGVRARIESCLFARRCLAPHTIVAGGRQAAVPHHEGSGPLPACEAIVIDIFPRHLEHGYWGDLTRTVVKGRPPPALRKMYAAVKAAQAAALDGVKAGARTAAVHRRAAEEMARRGFVTEVRHGVTVGFKHGTGHGVGLDIHEAPRLATGPGRLRSGNVITVEPGLYYPEIGGVRIEDTVVVTRQGWRALAACDRRFEV